MVCICKSQEKQEHVYLYFNVVIILCIAFINYFPLLATIYVPKKSISQTLAMLTFLLYQCALILMFLQGKISISGSMFPQGTAMKLSYRESWFVSLKKITENTSHRRLLLRNHLL